MSSRTEHQSTKTTRTTTTVHERREYRAYCGCCDCMWIIATVEGWLKLLQWLTTFLAFVIILATFDAPIESYKNYPEYGFMLFVGITSWVFVTIHIILKLPHLFERLPMFLLHPIVGVACCLLGALCFLVASSVVLAYAKGNGGLEASAACGYIAMFLFAFEALYIFCRGRRATKRETTEKKTVEKVEKAPSAEKLNPEENKEDEKEKQPETIHEFPK